MKWRLPFLLIIAFLLAGCNGRPTKLESMASSLKPGMNKSEVKQLFADFRLLSESNEVVKVNWATKWYNTNKESASWILYGPKQEFVPTLESCMTYFDTNDVIIAQYYTPPG
jgi:hypothetical protein